MIIKIKLHYSVSRKKYYIVKKNAYKISFWKIKYFKLKK